MNKITDEIYTNSLIREIKLRKCEYGITNEMIGKRIGLHENTVGRYINNPIKFTVGQLKTLTKYLKLSSSTVTAFIMGDCR